MSKKINGMSASFYKLMYYPPGASDWNEDDSKNFFDTQRKKEKIHNAKVRHKGNGTSVTKRKRVKR